VILPFDDFCKLFPQDRPSQYIFIKEDGYYRHVIANGSFEITYDLLKDYEHESNNYHKIILEIYDDLPIFVHKDLIEQKVRLTVVSKSTK